MSSLTATAMRIFSILSQLFPPKSHFSVDDVPDLNGKVTIVTGANVGKSENARVLEMLIKDLYVQASEKKLPRSIDKATNKPDMLMD